MVEGKLAAPSGLDKPDDFKTGGAFRRGPAPRRPAGPRAPQQWRRRRGFWKSFETRDGGCFGADGLRSSGLLLTAAGKYGKTEKKKEE